MAGRPLSVSHSKLHLQPERVKAKLNKDEAHLVSGRPAFHYRLPDCDISEPDWSAATAWNQWVSVENLAADEALLAEMIAEWRATRERYSMARATRWVLRLTHLLSNKYLAG